MTWKAIVELILPEAEHAPVPADGSQGDGSRYERLAIPHQYQPRLSVSDAAVFALRALLRIFLGSVLFGAWGAYTLLAWTSIANPYLRSAAMVPLFALFLVLLTGLMIVTAWPRRLRRP